MPRTIPESIRAVLDSQDGEIHDLVDITLPQQIGELEPTVLHLATAGITVAGQVYQPDVREIGTIKFTIGSSPDQAPVSIQNASNLYGIVFSDPIRLLDGSKCVIKRAFYTGAPDGGFETDTLLIGYIRDIKVDSQFVKFSVISDRSRRSTAIASVKISQRCSFVYNNFNGQLGIGPKCGWVPAVGLDLNNYPHALATECDLSPDGPNGCKAHRNRHRFGGIPNNLPPNAGAQVGTGFEGGIGTIYGACYIAGTPVTLPDRSKREIQTFQHGDPVSSMFYNPETRREERREGHVDEVLSHIVNGYFLLKLNNQPEVGVTGEHRYYIGSGQYYAVDLMEPGDQLYVEGDNGIFVRDHVASKVWIRKPDTMVYNLVIPEWRNYVAGNALVSNSKSWQMPSHTDPDYIAQRVLQRAGA